MAKTSFGVLAGIIVVSLFSWCFCEFLDLLGLAGGLDGDLPGSEGAGLKARSETQVLASALKHNIPEFLCRLNPEDPVFPTSERTNLLNRVAWFRALQVGLIPITLKAPFLR